MIPYDRLTILRNRSRVRDLRVFRELVERFLEQTEGGAEDGSVDWEGVRATRSRINRMLPRVIQVVHAAGLDAPANAEDPRPLVADVTILRNIFGARSVDGTDQQILDLIDMALGVYEATLFNTLVRTFNPLHYVLRAFAYVASVPRRSLTALGLWPSRSRAPHLRTEDLARIEAAALRLADAEGLIERRFAELRAQQSQHIAAHAAQLEDLHERLDFTERVLAQREPVKRIKSPDRNEVITPAGE
jgi:hypothetical protein